jgi:hypothetical protein
MAHKRRTTKTEHPSLRPQPERPSNKALRGPKLTQCAPRLPGHGMR